MIIFILLSLGMSFADPSAIVETELYQKVSGDFELVYSKRPGNLMIDWKPGIKVYQKCDGNTLFGIDLSSMIIKNEGEVVSDLYLGGSAGPEYVFYSIHDNSLETLFEGNLIAVKYGDKSCSKISVFLHGSHFNRAGNLYGEKNLIYFSGSSKLGD